MFRVAICEDEQLQLDSLQTSVETWGEAKRQLLQVDTYSSAGELLHYYRVAGRYDLVLLDIAMSGMDGMTAARAIRGFDLGAKIIFITGQKEYLAEGYEVEAFRYLLKPIHPEQLFSVLDAVVDKLVKQNGETLLFATETGQVKIRLADISYFESRGHFLEVHYLQGKIKIRANLSTMEQNLKEQGFIRNHRSYLVNLRRIYRLTSRCCHLDDGKKVPVSRKQYNALKEAFMNWVAG